MKTFFSFFLFAVPFYLSSSKGHILCVHKDGFSCCVCTQFPLSRSRGDNIQTESMDVVKFVENPSGAMDSILVTKDLGSIPSKDQLFS